MIELKDVTISVGRPQGGNLQGHHEYIRIEIVDNAARIRVMQLDMTLEEFAKMITGRSDNKVGRAMYHGTDHVGKVRVSEKRRAFITKEEISAVGGSYPRQNIERWLMENKQEVGWYVDPYLGSQTSTEYDHANGGEWLNYRVYKYVPYE